MIPRRSICLCLAVLLMCVSSSCARRIASVIADASSSSEAREHSPNIVIILTDDQGWADIGTNGARGFATPNIDRLAREGRSFTDFYVAQPVCSASRAALLTGCYPNRLGIHGALGPGAKHGIHEDETTIAEVCRSQGYATACVGKWHLGHHEQFLPTQHGFDTYYGLPYSNDMWPWHPEYVDLPPEASKRKKGYPDLPLIENATIVNPIVTAEDQERLTHDYTVRAVGFIEEHAQAGEPFLLYLAHTMPHVPLYTTDAFRGASTQGAYGDVIMEIDWSVGQVMNALDRLGIADDTWVIFCSDNGPWLSYGNHAGSTGPLREGKGTTWEGGVRVPCVMRWPGRIPAGTACAEPLMTIDLLPTICGVVDAPLPVRRIDGRDVWPVIAGLLGATSPHEAYFFYYHANHLESMRAGRWKMHFPHNYRSLTGMPGMDGKPGGYSQQHTDLALYDLKTDIGETRNVAAEHPEVVERLSALAEAMRADLGDALVDMTGDGRREPGRVGD